MSDFNKDLYDLIGQRAGWALLRPKDQSAMAKLMRHTDGDWDFYEKGTLAEMTALFNRLAGANAMVQRVCGLGLEEFDKKYPHADWQEIESFVDVADKTFTAWKRKRIRSINPPSMITTAMRDLDDEIMWEVIWQGDSKECKHRFGEMKGSMAHVPEPAPEPVNEYASHPNFGRF